MARETVIASFIMRFVKPGVVAATSGADAGHSGPPVAARIAVRHVQSGYERRFVDLDDAMDFIREEIRLLEQD
jgi:hypothetical protein